MSEVEVKVEHTSKDRSLKGLYRDDQYPTKLAFYLYGTEKSMNIEHVLVKSPNIQLSAENVQLENVSIPPEVPREGALVFVDEISERAMQPFQSAEGSDGDLLGQDPTFFFRPGHEFQVSVYKDAKAFDQHGPGLLQTDSHNFIGSGAMRLPKRSSMYIDSIKINEDPYEVKEGTENFRAWKKVFDSIGKELD